MVAQSVDDLFQQAREAMEGRNWSKSRQLYLQALAIKSDSPDVHYGLASVCFQMNDLPSAAYHFKEVTRLDPLRAGAFINLGAVYNLLEQFDDAIPVLCRAIQLDAQRAEGYYNLALVYRHKGQIQQSIQAYQDTLRVNPRMHDAHFNLANLHMELEEYDQAMTHYKFALQLRPNWDKAAAGLEQAREALAEEEEREYRNRTIDQLAAHASKGDPERSPSPKRQDALLSSMQRAALDSESCGQHLQQILDNEIEPALKELSAYLLAPDASISELDPCVQKLEAAVQNLRGTHRTLLKGIEKVRALGDRLLQK